ncbi:MAG: hypothetical protein JXQ87_18130 [Bacteroidia bacterium]
MKCNSVLVIVFLSFFSLTAKADQCKWISYKQANDAIRLLAIDNELVLYCQPCDINTKTKVRIDSTYVKRINSKFCELGIVSVSIADNKAIKKTIDLAYAFVNDNGYAISLASKLKLPCEGIKTDYFLWPIIDAEVPNVPNTTCTLLIEKEAELLDRMQQMFSCNDVMLSAKVGRKIISEKLISTEISIDPETNWMRIEQKSASLEISYSFSGQYIGKVESIDDNTVIHFESLKTLKINGTYKNKTIKNQENSTLNIPFCDHDEILRLAVIKYAACCKTNKR